MNFSISRDIIIGSNQISEEFIKKFDFFLDEIDLILKFITEIGLKDLNILNEESKNNYLTYLFILQSSITTFHGALTLFSHNLFSDNYALIRILYESSSLLYYGNQSDEKKAEICNVFFKSKLSGKNQGKSEFNLIQKAEKLFELKEKNLDEIRDYLNRFGSHISRDKIVLGNISSNNKKGIKSSINENNFTNSRFIMGLEILYSIMFLIITEYCKHLKKYNAISNEKLILIESFNNNLIYKLRNFK